MKPQFIEVDASQFARAMRDLSKRTGIELPKVLRNETGVILKTCAKRTKVAKKGKVLAARARLRAIKRLGYTRGDITVNAGIKGDYGRVWHRKPNGKYLMTRQAGFRKKGIGKFSKGFEIDTREAISDVKSEAAGEVQRARKSVGLARQSWLHIGDSLGIRLENIKTPRVNLKSARAAMASDGKRYRNGYGKETKRAFRNIITLVNTLPWGRSKHLRLNSVLARTVNGRTKFFYANLRRGVFKSQSATARKYPGLYVR